MKAFIVVLLALTSVACAYEAAPGNTAYGYLANVAIPRAEQIRQAEERASRIVGGVPAAPAQYPWQAGLLSSIIGLNGTGVCGGSLISANRVVTAAHCWFDGVNQAWKFTVVLGSVLLFSGGTRIDTSVVATHPNWQPLLVRNDVGVIYLPTPVSSSVLIAPVPLPSGSDLNNDFAGETAVASGFGITSDGSGISNNQFLSHVRLNVISNTACSVAFPVILQSSNICTSGVGGVGTCGGDSGGPLVVDKGGLPVLIGITSFGSAFGCETIFPAAFARVTSFMDFFNQHIQSGSASAEIE